MQSAGPRTNRDSLFASPSSAPARRSSKSSAYSRQRWRWANSHPTKHLSNTKPAAKHKRQSEADAAERDDEEVARPSETRGQTHQKITGLEPVVRSREEEDRDDGNL